VVFSISPLSFTPSSGNSNVASGPKIKILEKLGNIETIGADAVQPQQVQWQQT